MSSLKPVEKIEIIQADFPIYHSDYITWQVNLATMKKKERELIGEFYKAMLEVLKDDVLVDLLHFKINDLPFTYENIQDLDIKSAIAELKRMAKIPFDENNSVVILMNQAIKKSQPVKENESKKDINAIIGFLDIFKTRAEQSENPEFFYHQVAIFESDLLEEHQDSEGKTYRVIKKCFQPFLRYLDLSKIDFSNTDLRHQDLSDTNIKQIDFKSLYQNSLEGTNLEDVCLGGLELTNINARNANLLGTYLRVDASSVDITGMLYDDTVIIFYLGSSTYMEKRGPKRIRTSKLHF